MIAISLLLSLGSCSTPSLPLAGAEELPRLAQQRPVAVLFSIPGCRYCKIAERGFHGARKVLGQRVVFRKVMVDDGNLDRLRSRYSLDPSMPQARLLLAPGRWRKLPLTREGPLVAKAIEDALRVRIRGTRFVQ